MKIRVENYLKIKRWPPNVKQQHRNSSVLFLAINKTFLRYITCVFRRKYFRKGSAVFSVKNQSCPKFLGLGTPKYFGFFGFWVWVLGLSFEFWVFGWFLHQVKWNFWINYGHFSRNFWTNYVQFSRLHLRRAKKRLAIF